MYPLKKFYDELRRRLEETFGIKGIIPIKKEKIPNNYFIQRELYHLKVTIARWMNKEYLCKNIYKLFLGQIYERVIPNRS